MRCSRSAASAGIWSSCCVWFDGQGLCLFSKRLDRGRFVWPVTATGTVTLTPAQLSMLLEGIDWRRPERTFTPTLAG